MKTLNVVNKQHGKMKNVIKTMFRGEIKEKIKIGTRTLRI